MSAPHLSRLQHLSLLVLVLLASACRSACADRATPTAAPGPAVATKHFGGGRPALVIANEGAKAGLLLALHGYGDTAANFVAALDLPALARQAGFVLVAPDGTADPRGQRFWNATDACCNFFDATVDDVAYLRGLLVEVGDAYHVEPQRRYVLGLSNGAFMAHRLACETADDIAAIVAIAGMPWSDPGRCRPRSPVSVLQVHGDADRIVSLGGGGNLLGQRKGDYPGSVTTVERWARLDGCAARFIPVPPPLDLDREPGAETRAEQATGCPPGVDVRLLVMQGGAHVPAFAPAFGELVWAWLAAHPKVAARAH